MLNFLTWLLTPGGNWLHAIILLAALEAPAVLAWNRWQAQRHADPQDDPGRARGAAWARLAVTAALLLVVRALTLSLSLVIPAGSADARVVLPPLERASALLTALLIARAFAEPTLPARGEWLLAGQLGLVGMGLAASWWVWPATLAAGARTYNGSGNETLWELATLAVLAAGAWGLIRRRGPGWLGGVAVLGLLLVAHLGHYLYPLGGTDAPLAVRWGELLAVPAAMIVLYRRAERWPYGAPAAEAVTVVRPAAQPRAGFRLLDVVTTFLVAVLAYGAIEVTTGRYRVEGPSMQPTLHAGEYVAVNRLAYRLGAPARGDIVVVRLGQFEGPDRNVIKRVVGLPGERIDITAGVVRINGRAYPEPYRRRPATYSGSWTVGPDEYFVLGDNRDDSSDSHIWGSIHRRSIEGKAMFVYWPPGEWTAIEHYQPER